MKTRESIEAAKTDSDRAPNERPKYRRGENPRSLANLVAPWQPGQSGNPGGRKSDMFAEISRAAFENNPELIYKACVKGAAKGQAFLLQVMADRAYGKLKETRDVSYVDSTKLSYSEIQERVAQLERELYPAVFPRLAAEADEAGRTSKAQAGSEAAEDTHVLPGNGATKA